MPWFHAAFSGATVVGALIGAAATRRPADLAPPGGCRGDDRLRGGGRRQAFLPGRRWPTTDPLRPSRQVGLARAPDLWCGLVVLVAAFTEARQTTGSPSLSPTATSCRPGPECSGSPPSWVP
jgi:hypothetical protein